MEKLVKVLNVGRLGFGPCLQLQHQVREKVRNKMTDDALIIVEHSPVYTVGIREKLYSTQEEAKLKELGAEFYRTNRGGLITFHGPGQMVVYPIINLKNYEPSVRWYVCQLEKTIIQLCSQLNIEAHTSPHTGVWVNDAKICAIGIHASRYITTHGLALNCNTNLKWFEHIVPCGIEGKSVTSLTRELKTEFTIQNAVPLFLECFEKQFKCKMLEMNYEERNHFFNECTSSDSSVHIKTSW